MDVRYDYSIMDSGHQAPWTRDLFPISKVLMDRTNQLCLPQLLRGDVDFFKLSASRTQIQYDINNSYKVHTWQ